MTWTDLVLSEYRTYRTSRVATGTARRSLPLSARHALPRGTSGAITTLLQRMTPPSLYLGTGSRIATDLHAPRALLHGTAPHSRPPGPGAPSRRRASRPPARPRARPVTSALHHAPAFARALIFAAVLRGSTTVRALGAATSAGAREGEARRREERELPSSA